MGKKGFWDEQKRWKKLNQKKPMLRWLNENINWEHFRSILETIYSRETKGHAGRQSTDVIVMFKLLILQQMYAISDDELEFQVHDRISFMEFLGLGIEDPIPDAKTVCWFRDNLAKHDLIKQVFSQFDDYLRKKGYVVAGGQIVNATLVPVPMQPNTRQENRAVQEGNICEQ